MKNYLKLFGACAIWAIINGLVVKGVRSDPTANGLWMAVVGIAIFMATNPMKGPSGTFSGISRKAKLLLFALGAAAGINNVFFYTALKMTDVSKVALIHYLAQPISVILLVWFLKEKLTKNHIWALATGLAGIALVAYKRGEIKLESWLTFALLSAIFYASEILFSKWLGNEKVKGTLSAFSKLFFQVIAMAIGAVLLGQSLQASRMEMLQLIAAGALLYVSFVWVFGALKTVPGRDFSIIGYVDRLGAVVIGILIWHEKLTLNVTLGGLLILAAQAIVLFGRNRDEKPEKS